MSHRHPFSASLVRACVETLEDRRLMSFAPAVNYPVGVMPENVETADFNRDGRLDLAVANWLHGSVSVLLGDGSGHFGARRDFPAGGFDDLAVGDFNNDGKLDIATAAYTGVCAVLGNGDGTFGAPLSTPMMNAYASSVAVADFNLDGIADLAVGGMYYDPYIDIYWGSVSVLFGVGNGTFRDAGYHDVGGHSPSNVVIADVNRDGRPDAITTDYDYSFGSGIVSVLLGSAASPTHLEYASLTLTGGEPNSLTVGDFNSDGIPDILTVGETVDVLIGSGDGSFGRGFTISANTPYLNWVEADDFNRDGKLDVVIVDSENVAVFLGRGDGTVSLASSHAVGSPLALAVGNFNADSRPDVAVANVWTDNVTILINDGIWGAIPPTRSLRIGDAQIIEGSSGTTYATFIVELSSASDKAVTVNFTTQDSTAIGGSDYQAQMGTVTFTPGQTTATIRIAILGDSAIEYDERFDVVLSGSSANISISDALGTALILNDDKSPGRGRKK